MVKSEQQINIKAADMITVVPATPGKAGERERQEHSPGRGRGAGSSVLLSPPQDGLIPDHRGAGPVTSTGIVVRRHERDITQVVEAAGKAPTVTITDGTSGTDDGSGGGRRRRRVRQRPARDRDDQAAQPREPGMAGSEPPPPGEPGTEATGESREERINRILERNKEALRQWHEEHEGQANLLDLTEDAAKGLIPRRLLELVNDPEEVAMRIRRNPDDNELEIAVVIPSQTPVNNLDLYQSAQQELEDTSYEPVSPFSFFAPEPQPAPPGIDPMHWDMPGMVNSETLEMTDIPLVYGRLRKVGPDHDADIYIDKWQVREVLDDVPLRQQGLTRAFNRELEAFGREQNFRYIVGHNESRPETGSNVSVHDIYVRIGRTPYSEDLPEELKARFRERNYLEAPGDPDRLTFFDLTQSQQSATAESRQPLEAQRIVDRHPEWSDIQMQTDYFAHGTLPDMAHLRESLIQSRARIFFYEDVDVSDTTREILQRASEMPPTISPDEFLRAMEIEYGQQVLETFSEMYVRAVYGTGVIVAPLDVPPIGENPYSRRTTVENFDQTLDNLSTKYKDIADRTSNRDETTTTRRLEEELTRIFATYRELRTQGDEPLTAFVARAYNHEGTFDDRLRAQGFVTENISRQERHYLASDKIIKKFMADPAYEPTRQELLEAQMETIMRNVLGTPLVDDLELSEPEIYYYNIVTEQFSNDEAAVRDLHERYVNDRLGPRRLNRTIRGKGLGNIPSNMAELNQAIANYEAQHPSDASPAETPEQGFARFQTQIDEIQEAIDQGFSEIPHLSGTSSTGSLICWLEDPTDTRPPAERDRILTYFIPQDDDGTIRAQEQHRREALEIAAGIQDATVRESLEQMIEYNEATGQIITRVPRAPHIDILTADDRRAVTMDNLRAALHTINTMVENGIAPTSLNTSRLLDRQTGRIMFRDFLLLEQSDLAGDSPSQTVARVFGSLTRQFTTNLRDEEDIALASENFPKQGAAILRDHFLYEAPRLAFATEVVPRDQVEAVYEYALSLSDRELSRATLEASRLHDLALSRDGDTIEGRIALLRQAETAYDEIVYEHTSDGRKILKTDQFSLWTDERILQTRLALAYMPVSEIRIQEGDLTTEARTTLNHNLAELIKDMLPTRRRTLTRRAEGQFYGFTSEVVGLTLLSRQHVDTSIAVPTSEVRRIYEGPDASVLFSDERGYHEFDIDWKLEHQSGAGDVSVGRIALSILNEMPDARQVLELDNPTNRDAILFVARLLRDEGLNNDEGGRDLTDIETRYLNRVQQRVWERIQATAEGGNGITDLQDKARFSSRPDNPESH